MTNQMSQLFVCRQVHHQVRSAIGACQDAPMLLNGLSRIQPLCF